MPLVRSEVSLRQPEDGQYRPKHVVVHYIVIKYTSYDTVVFDYMQFSQKKNIYIHTFITYIHTYITYNGKSISIRTGVIIFYGLAVLLSARAC